MSMSDSLQTAAAAMTPEAVDAAVAASHAAPAPADEFGQFQSEMRTWMDRIERFVAEAGSFIDFAEPVIKAGASVVAPSAAPEVAAVLDRVSALEGFANDLSGALNTHFQGKIALPAAPAS
jgi:hypothetical protein